MITIQVCVRDGTTQTHAFDKLEVTIGRVEGNDLVLPRTGVSKRHARLVLKDGKMILVDLWSTNGTYLNGQRMEAPRHIMQVRPEDRVAIGDYVLTFAATFPPTAPWPPGQKVETTPPRTTSPAERVRLKVKTEPGGRLRFLDPRSNTGLGITFQRTLRIPDDGKTYPLPPGLGPFPIRRVLDYQGRVPESWVKTSGVFIPMYQREALWISFQSRHWRPNAVKVAAGKINAVSGKPWDHKLAPPDDPQRRGLLRRKGEPVQDYLTCPPQPWLDGFNTGQGTIRQFVAMPLGMGYTVEAQVTGAEEHGGLQIIVYDAKPGRFPIMPPPPPPMAPRLAMPAPCPPQPCAAPAPGGMAMGLGAGGTMKQKIYPDPHGIDTWDEESAGRVFVHIVNSLMWTEITGEPPPPTPVSTASYTNAGFPWFARYDEAAGDVAPSTVLAGVKSVAELDSEHGFVGVDDDRPVHVPASQVRGIPKDEVPDGEW